MRIKLKSTLFASAIALSLTSFSAFAQDANVTAPPAAQPEVAAANDVQAAADASNATPALPVTPAVPEVPAVTVDPNAPVQSNAQLDPTAVSVEQHSGHSQVGAVEASADVDASAEATVNDMPEKKSSRKKKKPL